MIVSLSQHILLFILASEAAQAILSGQSEASNNSSSESSTSDIAKQNKDPEANTTFYYEANSFLINKSEIGNSGSKQDDDQAEINHKIGKAKDFVPASTSSASGRNGRMLDLDALMGDFASSQSNKDKNRTGYRQSRYLQSGPPLDVGSGKKLHIQGFIPIVGVKDVTEDNGSESNEQDQENQLAKQPQRIQSQMGANELPYAQSSIGHASFGVQHYLNSEASRPQSQHAEAKFSGVSVVDSLKRPLKRLTGYNSVENQQVSSVQQQNCLCVPFYMCKNGHISESSLGKSQIQQMIAQQYQQVQQQQLNQAFTRQNEQQFEVKSGDTQKIEQHYADSFVPVDERSNDKEIVTMSGSIRNNDEQINQTDTSAMFWTQMTALNQTSAEDLLLNSTDLSHSDFSQEILGRMLGLKSANPQITPAISPQTGVCGLLRSCCTIPAHLFPSQQDMANEQLMAAQYGTLASQNRYQQQNGYTDKQSSSDRNNYHLKKQVSAIQKFQQPQVSPINTQQQRLPYGFPSRMQPLNSPLDTSLAHRSTQFTNSYPQQAPQVAQYSRATPQLQPLQSMQQVNQLYQQVKQLPVPLGAASYGSSQLAQQQSVMSPVRNPNTSLGTRKILEGRCGLRQAAGITGRVQNLAYHESSADFGEYPSQAAILKRLGGSDSLFVCGATLISQYWIATAAHCIKKHAQSDLKVRLGEWDVHRDDEFYPFVEKEVRDLVIHPEFVAGNLVNDIALLRLDSPVDPSLPHVNPACLPTIDESFTRQKCWVTGWGKDSFGQKGSFQAVLREVELPVVGQSQCEAALRQTRLGPHYRLHPGFICAGGEDGKDACEGDGGSGLYCIQDGLVKVAGLVSWGIGCGQAGVPGVYVNLAHYRPWIENIISIDEDIYSPHTNMLGNSLISERSNSNSSTMHEPKENLAQTTTLATELE